MVEKPDKDVVEGEDFMIENSEFYEPEAQCANGAHEFQELPVSASGEFGILIGYSRCRCCGVGANDGNVEPSAGRSDRHCSTPRAVPAAVHQTPGEVRMRCEKG